MKKDRFARLVKDGVISQDEFAVVDSEVRSKEANLKQARVKLARMSAIVTNNRAKINQAKAKVYTAKVMQGYTTITSPISGIVQERNVDPGMVVQPSMGIVTTSAFPCVLRRTARCAIVSEGDSEAKPLWVARQNWQLQSGTLTG